MKDSDVAKACGDLYASPETLFEKAWLTDGYVAAARHISGTPFIGFQGSKSAVSWLLDFDRLAFPADDPELGPVHPGFQLPKEIVAILDAYANGLPSPPVIGGHSRGAAQAALYAAHRCAVGKPPLAVVIFGCPKPGFARIAGLLDRVAVRNYRNQSSAGHDLVTDVPLSDTVLGLDYVEPAAFIGVSCPPPPTNTYDFFAWHHIALYQKALESQCEAG